MRPPGQEEALKAAETAEAAAAVEVMANEKRHAEQQAQLRALEAQACALTRQISDEALNRQGAQQRCSSARHQAQDLRGMCVRARRRSSAHPWEWYAVVTNGFKQATIRAVGQSDSVQQRIRADGSSYEVHPDDRHLIRCLQPKEGQ